MSTEPKERRYNSTDIFKTAIVDTAVDHFRKGDALVGADRDQRLQLGYSIVDETPLSVMIRLKPPGLNGPRYFTIKVSENL